MTLPIEKITPVLSPRYQIKRSFSHAAQTYEQAASHQKNIAQRLVGYYENYDSSSCEVALDLGCGTGFINEYGNNKNLFNSCVNLDLSEDMLKVNHHPLSICSDIQNLPFMDSSFDACLSSYAFQWSSNIDHLFKELYRVLKPGGKLFFSVPGVNTFSEIKAAWLSVDQDIHVHDFLTSKNWQLSGSQAGFSSVYFLEDESVLNFPDQKASLQHIKKIGAHNLASDRPKNLMGKQRYKKFNEAFKACSKNKSDCTLSYHNYFFGFSKEK